MARLTDLALKRGGLSMSRIKIACACGKRFVATLASRPCDFDCDQCGRPNTIPAVQVQQAAGVSHDVSQPSHPAPFPPAAGGPRGVTPRSQRGILATLLRGPDLPDYQRQVTDPDGRRAMYALVGLVTLVGIGICGLDVTMQWVAGGVDWPRWCIMSLGFFLIGWYLLAACLLEWKWFFNTKAMRRIRAGGHDLFARMFYVGISGIFFLISFSTSASSIVRAVRWSAISMASGRSAGESQSEPESMSEQRTRQATMEIVAIATAAPIPSTRADPGPTNTEAPINYRAPINQSVTLGRPSSRKRNVADDLRNLQPQKRTWRVTPDVAPDLQTGFLTEPLSIAIGTVKGVKFSSAETGQAAVLLGDPDTDELTLYRCDLRRRKVLARTELPSGSRLEDFAADAKVIATSAEAQQGDGNITISLLACGDEFDERVATLSIENHSIVGSYLIGSNRLLVHHSAGLTMYDCRVEQKYMSDPTPSTLAG